MVNDTLFFYLNEYFIELNQDKLKFLKIFNFWIELSGKKDNWIIFELNIPEKKIIE